MKPIRNTFPLLAIAVASLTTARAQDPLPSWNEGPAKKSIIEFVAKVSKEGTPDFVPPAERIATFDNDGTLWCEQPLYTQIFFALDRVKVLAAECREPCSSRHFDAVNRMRNNRLETTVNECVASYEMMVCLVCPATLVFHREQDRHRARRAP